MGEDILLDELVHNGVAIPQPPPPRGLKLRIRGEWYKLTPKQEEMALAWAKKHDTDYIEDPVFVANFLGDFSAELGIDPPLTEEEVDFEPAVSIIVAEKEAKEALTTEERKILTEERKAKREKLREQFGTAVVNGEVVDVANYVVEPSGIFMGRGEHPLRGRWKEGAKQEDVTLNLSPNAPRPEGNWDEMVWQPDSLWVARWKDKLSGRLKYVWFSDNARVKQIRDIEKFDEAATLGENLDGVRSHIMRGLTSDDPKQRQIATACFLIDELVIRVGDEKEADEADTVGATTLRPEHVTIHDDNQVEFRFLGKDSVLWHKKVTLPEQVVATLKELIANACPPDEEADCNDHPTRYKPQLFPDVTSRDVSEFLSDVLPFLSAKVFRTHHATKVVAEYLAKANVKSKDSAYKKWRAASLANREAALLCNHYKQESTAWPRRRKRFKERQEKAEARVEKYKTQIEEYKEKLAELKEKAQEQIAAAKSDKVREKRKKSYARRIASAQKRVRKARERKRRAQESLGKIKAKKTVASRTRTWNLGTSLKSYIDPRVYTRWGREVEYDVLEEYYPKKLREKFAWANEFDNEEPESEQTTAEATKEAERLAEAQVQAQPEAVLE